MKTKLKKYSILAGVAALPLYACVVIAFEAGLLYLQPTWKGTLVLTTEDASGTHRQRVISGLLFEDALYIRANHWPREWYYEALETPRVMVDRGEGPVRYLAVPVTGEEEARVNDWHRIRLKWRILTGFPPLKLLRLDPLPDQEQLP